MKVLRELSSGGVYLGSGNQGEGKWISIGFGVPKLSLGESD